METVLTWKYQSLLIRMSADVVTEEEHLGAMYKLFSVFESDEGKCHLELYSYGPCCCFFMLWWWLCMVVSSDCE